ncbi:ArgE/DapE family deacylase [Peribacillus frigoritolerans]|uniref:M20 family metallopeptidase n=1 Tax=Peribacillus frigoritolerans TaxID=450367 RepID=UPI002E1AE8E0|nr:ArgE/DapE family deacylase [Peribacillus frigoritolerans]MED3996830.1 ArgE/DapE family deacylase [Peribacillus frigoritolerans]
MSTRMIRQLIRSRQQELVELAASFIRIPSENPSPEFKKRSAEMGRHISRYLAAKGFLITEHRRSENALVTVVCDAPLTRVPGPRLLFCGHTDVVPAGDCSNWTFDPFSGEVRAGMLLGRGASDMKGGLASLIFVAGLLQEFAPTLNLKGSLGVIASPDEETGGIEVASLLDQGLIKGDACLIGEPTDRYHPNAGEKGKAWMQVTIPGQTDHGSLQPLYGISAVRRGAAAVEALTKLWELKATPPPEPCQLLYNTEWLLSQGLGNPLLSQLLYRPSYNPGVIQGGTNVNVVADKCIIKVDTRVPFGMKPEFVLDIARNLVSAVAPGAVVEPMVPCTNPNWTLEDRPIVRAIELGIQRVLGMEEPVFSVLLLGSSDASHFRRHGIETVLYGPGLEHTIHGYDERVSVENLVESAEIYAETAIKYLRSF